MQALYTQWHNPPPAPLNFPAIICFAASLSRIVKTIMQYNLINLFSSLCIVYFQVLLKLQYEINYFQLKEFSFRLPIWIVIWDGIRYPIYFLDLFRVHIHCTQTFLWRYLNGTKSQCSRFSMSTTPQGYRRPRTFFPSLVSNTIKRWMLLLLLTNWSVFVSSVNLRRRRQTNSSTTTTTSIIIHQEMDRYT